MNGIVAPLALVGFVAMGSPPAAAQETLPGLDQRQSNLLLCATSCQRAYNRCMEDADVPVLRVIGAGSDFFRNTPRRVNLAAFRCTAELQNCQAGCGEKYRN